VRSYFCQNQVISSAALEKLPHSEVHPVDSMNLDLAAAVPTNIDWRNFSCSAQLATLCGFRIAVTSSVLLPLRDCVGTRANVDLREVLGSRGIAIASPRLACERVEPERHRFA